MHSHVHMTFLMCYYFRLALIIAIPVSGFAQLMAF
jgi:hypothetical protein